MGLIIDTTQMLEASVFKGNSIQAPINSPGSLLKRSRPKPDLGPAGKESLFQRLLAIKHKLSRYDLHRLNQVLPDMRYR